MEKINVMVNGLPGDMAATVAIHSAADNRFNLLPYSLTGPEIEVTQHMLNGSPVHLIPPAQRQTAIKDIRNDTGAFISVDYTHPAAVNANAEFYCSNKLPFVMGTTGGDRSKLYDTVSASATAAVVAPNMAKQIVGFQAMMAYAAEQFPDLFKGFRLQITESHQNGKADTSGTAKAMVTHFNQLGLPFAEADIIKERDPAVQKTLWQIPEAYLGGHGWHTYQLISADETVRFEFQHNVNGRDVYARGTLDAVDFLHRKLAAGAEGRVFDMIDVLRGV